MPLISARPISALPVSGTPQDPFEEVAQSPTPGTQPSEQPPILGTASEELPVASIASGLEETAAATPTPVDTFAVSVTDATQEYPGLLNGLDESPAWQAPIDVAWTSVFLMPEEIVSVAISAALGEDSGLTNVIDTPPILSVTYLSQDFAGSIQNDEQPGWMSPIQEPLIPLTAASAGDDFAVGLSTDEQPMFVAWPWEPAPGLGSPAEDFAGSIPKDEQPGWIQTPDMSPVFPVVITYEGEDFTVGLSTDEQPFFVSLTPDVMFGFGTVNEDFQGANQIDEQPTWMQSYATDASAATAPTTEDFGGSHPTEEASTWSWSQAADAALAVVVLPEDFAGSLPLEEATVPPGVVVDASMPWTAGPSEEFGGAHPTEEVSTWFWSPTADVVMTAVVLPEEFAGSLPLEETTSRPWPTVEVRPLLSFTVPSEEFGGAHPTEEQPTTWQQTDLSVWIGVTYAAEEFAGSLPLEETFASLQTFESLTIVAAVDTSEPFAGAIPTEETSPLLFVEPSPTWLTLAVVTEEPAGALPTEEVSPLRHSIERLAVVTGHPSPTEDAFAQTLVVEESSITITIIVRPPSLWTSLVSEEIFIPTPPTPPTPPGPVQPKLHRPPQSPSRGGGGAANQWPDDRMYAVRDLLRERKRQQEAREAERLRQDAILREQIVDASEPDASSTGPAVVEEPEVEASVVLPVGQHARVRAEIDGIVNYGPESTATITTDDGARYVYAGVDQANVGPGDGTRVEAGETIGRSVGATVERTIERPSPWLRSADTAELGLGTRSPSSGGSAGHHGPQRASSVAAPAHHDDGDATATGSASLPPGHVIAEFASNIPAHPYQKSVASPVATPARPDSPWLRSPAGTGAPPAADKVGPSVAKAALVVAAAVAGATLIARSGRKAPAKQPTRAKESSSSVAKEVSTRRRTIRLTYVPPSKRTRQETDPGYPPYATIQEKWTRCGKDDCYSCPHGPYLQAVWWGEDGKVKTKYLGKKHG